MGSGRAPGPWPFEQADHLITLHPAGPLAPGREIRITIAYSGRIDERYCYLDIPDSRYWGPLKFWLVSLPKRYAVVSDEFIHLTPECGWYPRAGLPPSLMFPRTIKQDFVRYSLTATIPDVLTAVSQGAVSVNPGRAGAKVFSFKPDGPLPQISLTAGRYIRRSVVVDGTEYSLSTLSGHDQFLSMLSELTSDLPSVIRQARNEYEGLLGLAYPFKRLALVEVPIQIASYARLWNSARESVQPEIIYLPERGALCTGADFWSVQRASFGPRAGGAAPAAAKGGAAPARGAAQAPAAARGVRGQAATLNAKDLQRALLNRFIRFNVTELAQASNAPFRAGTARHPDRNEFRIAIRDLPPVRDLCDAFRRPGLAPLRFSHGRLPPRPGLLPGRPRASLGPGDDAPRKRPPKSWPIIP